MPLRSWSSSKTADTGDGTEVPVEEVTTSLFDEISTPANTAHVEGEGSSSLRSWSKKQSAQVAPEPAEPDSRATPSPASPDDDAEPASPDVASEVAVAVGAFRPKRETMFQHKVTHGVEKIKKGHEAWAAVRKARESGDHKVFREVKRRATEKKTAGRTASKHERDRTHRITDEIDKIRIMQAHKIKETSDNRKHTEKTALVKAKTVWYRRPIHPRTPAKELWDVMCIVLVLFSSVEIPLALAFPYMEPMGAVLEAMIDVIFIVDVVLCFRTGYDLRNGEVEMIPEKIVKNYLQTWFPIDFCACFPLEVIFSGSGDGAEGDKNAKLTTLLRLLKLPRLLRLGRIFKYMERFKYAGAMKIVRFILGIIMIAHWVGCTFFFIMYLEGEDGRGTWLEDNVGLRTNESIWFQYTILIYAAFKMLIGEGMEMQTPTEQVFGAGVLLLGTVVTAVIVGNVSFVVSNQNSTSYKYHSKVDMVTDEMRALQLPVELQDRTIAYYEYLWNRHRTFDPSGTRFTQDLSPTLRTEILLHMNKDVIVNCAFFRKCSNECILRLVHAFRYRVFLTDDVIAEEGQASQEMVFLIHGNARIMQLGHRMPIGLMQVGDYFGEKSLLMHHRNAVSIIANCNTDTRVLVKREFEDICIDFPDLRDEITKTSTHNDVTESGNNFRGDTRVGGEEEQTVSTEGRKKKRSMVAPSAASLSEYSFQQVSQRPASSNQAARIIEVVSSVHLMKDTLEELILDTKRGEDRMNALEEKIDALLRR